MNEWIDMLTAAGMSEKRAPSTAKALVIDEVNSFDNAETIEKKIQNGTSGYSYNGADNRNLRNFLENREDYKKLRITDTHNHFQVEVDLRSLKGGLVIQAAAHGNSIKHQKGYSVNASNGKSASLGQNNTINTFTVSGDQMHKEGNGLQIRGNGKRIRTEISTNDQDGKLTIYKNTERTVSAKNGSMTTIGNNINMSKGSRNIIGNNNQDQEWEKLSPNAEGAYVVIGNNRNVECFEK